MTPHGVPNTHGPRTRPGVQQQNADTRARDTVGSDGWCYSVTLCASYVVRWLLSRTTTRPVGVTLRLPAWTLTTLTVAVACALGATTARLQDISLGVGMWDDEDDDDIPVKFNPVVLIVAPLVILRSLAEGVVEAAELVEYAIDSHLRFQKDMRAFQMVASMEIESLTTDDE